MGMDATVDARDHRRDFELTHGLLGLGAAVAAICLMAVAFLFSVRRIAGALHEALPESLLLVVGLVAAGLALSLRFGLRNRVFPQVAFLPRGWRLVIEALPAAPVLIIALSLSLPGTSNLGLVALWAPIAAGEGIWLIGRARRTAASAPDTAVTTAPTESTQPATTRTMSETEPDRPSHVSQQIQRGWTEDNHDSCFGWVRATFEPGQRTETIHLTFCPPFQETPQLRVEQLEGPEMQIKQAQVLPYGARLELRLAKIDKSRTEAVVEFIAIDDLSSANGLRNNGARN
jgi:hypothetical protein